MNSICVKVKVEEPSAELIQSNMLPSVIKFLQAVQKKRGVQTKVFSPEKAGEETNG